ncbi:glycosyltransferase family 39 protein [Capillimicrobium parvum]|uniref:Glycosyltransferase RgtA/B/C/D-like domain-containing protein n=1 Tax=Capillimicrobium parvum TaxID=2884022 RepID=A0A9E6Y0K9_9ACTN|nr:glycosyltransferase family 39 protein [Capillimicrobium parvum]UGS37884.1 hypothetical protein DSM104329_04305 [Capillimicrobium parvum]
MSTPALLTRPLRRGGVVREQAFVAGAQVASGVGNLAFSLVAAHLLAPGAFADLVAFLALYLLVHVPASSLSAGAALTPAAVPGARRGALGLGVAAGLALVVAAVPLGAVLGVPAGLLVVLAAGVPLAPWLALERGRLYGEREHGRAALSLVAEPVARLALGLPLVAAFGVAGGAAAVVAGGWLALAATRPRFAAAGGISSREHGLLRFAGAATAAFLVLAVLQNQDVVLANALLDGGEAGRFAVLSTLGGLAAFASTTVPLVLLPRARAGDRGALGAAVGAAAVLGLAAVLAVAMMPRDLIGAAFGERYAETGALAVPYVAAMGLFGVARVLLAHRIATADGRRARVVAVAVPAAIAAAQALAIVAWGTDPGRVAVITLAAMATLVAATAPGVVVPFPLRGALARRAGGTPARVGLAVAGITVAALVVRLLSNRGIWLDEATSITQAQMSLGGLLDSLRTTDVHPPLHHLMLWALAHTAGTSEFVMRAPSVVAGTALVPALYATAAEVWDRRAGLAAAAMGAVAPFLVWYSQEARMYGLFMLFATLALLGQLRALRRGRPADWALYVAASAALVWTQYFGVLVVGVQQAAFALAAMRDRRLLRPWLLSVAALALALAPLAAFAHDQFQANEAAGRGFDQPSQAGSDVSSTRTQPGVYIALTNVVWAIWGYHSNGTMAAITALWPLGLLLALLLLGRGRSPRTLLVAACALLPAIALFFVGELKPFLFEIRYFAALAPLTILLLARAATGWTGGRVATVAVTAALVGSLAVASADEEVNRANPRVYDFEGALARIEREARPGDLVLYQPKYLRDVVTYYAPDLHARPLQGALDGPVAPAGRVFVLGSFQDQRGERDAVRAGLRELARTRDLQERFKRPQVKVWVYR